MTNNKKRLLDILKDMFQFDQSDLDFGIYRILGMKRREVNGFIEEELPKQITEGLRELAELDSAANLAAIDKQITDTKAAPLSDAIKIAAVAELQEKKKLIEGSVDVAKVEAEVYNHLTNFFSRYYDDGDFISQRRYKDGAYAIPYEGEEVKLHWANADQYYVKTSEYFKDYTFKTSYGDIVQFKLVEAETERDNNKSTEKRFFQIHTEKPFELINGALIIYVEYKNGDKKNQPECTSEIIAAFTAVHAQYSQFSPLLTVSNGKTLLERQLNRYTARNTFDYFIHKDLGKFLNRELDFYIKNDVIFLDDIDEHNDAKAKEYMTKAKVIRKIARKIITFLAQIEDFQKKLYLKKKFVVETNYGITLDRIPEDMYPEILANDAQREEWVSLFAIDEITGGDLFTVPYSVPLTVGFLKANPFLLLDTAFFNMEFKEKLIAGIDRLDDNLDGLMIQSENSQALRLLQDQYKGKINCVYADPPYNAKSSEILYKNNFKHSSWISFMHERLVLASILKAKDAAMITAIDDNEFHNLLQLYNICFPNWMKTSISIVHNPAGVQGDNFSYSHEYALYAFENQKGIIGKTDRDEESEESFRDWGGTSARSLAKNCFYPIYVENGEIVGFGDVCPDDFHPDSSNIVDGDTIEVYPISDDGLERKWVFARESVEAIFDDLVVSERAGIVTIRRIKTKTSYKTVWADSKYYANIFGSKLLNNILGTKKFDFPKSVFTVQDCLFAVNSFRAKDSIALDYFAGSGTTGHAVVNLNRADEGKRKYILIEMGKHFDTATKPRVMKVIYSEDWKKGKPVLRKGISHTFKYLRLESYEDALNNISLRDGNYDLLGEAREGYILSYMLDVEAEGASLLNVDKLDKPFSYTMNITRNQESTERTIDLVETFNYLIGLTVTHNHALTTFDADFSTGEYGAVTAVLKDGINYKFKSLDGALPNEDKALVIWREMTGDIVKDNAALDAYFLSLPDNRSYRKVYVNCNNNLLNLRGIGENWQVILIDEEMKKRMFDTAE